MKAEPNPLFISTMKNEGPYILEWLAYHRVIGFSQFLIYTNDCTDGTTDLLDRLAVLGCVQHERNVVLRRGPHKSALKYAKEHPLTKSAEWIYVADIDEYLNIHVGDGKVQDLIAAHPEADAIPVTWRLFSHGDQLELEDPYLLETLCDAERTLEDGGQKSRFVKTLFRNDHRVERFGLHTPIVSEEYKEDFRWIAPDGRVLGVADNKSRPESQFAYDGAQVNHYAVRSLDGYLVKKDRGRANHYRQNLGTDYWRRMCRGGHEDRSIQRHLPAVRAEMARLLEDKRLADLHASSLAWHKAKVVELRALSDFEALRNEILALSEAKDHHRKEDSDHPVDSVSEGLHAIQNLAQASKHRPVGGSDDLGFRKDVSPLLTSLRQTLQCIQPLEAQLEAAGLINRLEAVYERKVSSDIGVIEADVTK